MTGPPYPHPNPAPGSNAIGFFAIGVSPVGTISEFDPWATIISQYSNSPILDTMITEFNAAVDETQNLDNFFDMIWNVLTAQGYGLDVWGRIVGVPRSVQIVSSSSQFFGFEEPGGWQGFGGGGSGAPFYSGQALTGNVTLADVDYRRLILAKAASNISDGSIQSTNSILLNLFAGRGTAYVADGLNMTATIHTSFTLNATDTAVLQLPGVIPIPVGVAVSYTTP
jgi:hypothetical protein